MSDEKNGIKNGAANNEDMAPQEDGTKVPLTADGVEVKFSSNVDSGDAKIDMPGGTHVFSGLTKEELMEYANDPFWKRMRWFLFISFWLAWIAMLVAAIAIIVMAPRCTPPLHWMQDSAMMGFDQDKISDVNTDEVKDMKDVLATAKQLNMTAIYVPGLISDKDFSKPAEKYTDIDVLLKGAKDAKLDVVTDFVTSDVASDNVWLTSNPGFFSGTKLDFSNEAARGELQAMLKSWIEQGVKGFFMNEEDTTDIKTFLNEGIADTEGLVVTDVMDMSDILSAFTVNKFRDFLKTNAMGNDLTWNWFKYNPTAGKTAGLSEDLANLVTLSLYAAPGTPVLEGLDSQADINSTAEILKYVSPLRKQQVMHFSNTSWTKDPVENVISFARYLTGTTNPGFAVAVNMDESNNATVSFASINAVPDTGKLSVEWPVSGDAMGTDISLKSVFLEPLSGKIIKFEPKPPQ